MPYLMLAAFVGASLTAAALTLAVRQVSRRVGFVDRPNEPHKQHAAPVAYGGGVAIFLTIALPLVAATALARVWIAGGPPAWLPAFVQEHLPGMASKLTETIAIVAGGLILLGLGLWDDLSALPAWPKFGVQLIVAVLLAAFFGVRIMEFLPAPLSVVVTVVWIVFVTNAFNFLDNMDGLCAGVAAICGAIFALSAAAAGQVFVPALAWTVVGAAVGFLLFNFAPATIYMGDAGSTVLGYFLAVLTALTTFYDERLELQPYGVLVPPVVLAVPLYDAISVIVRRLRAGHSIFRGDRRHFSHRLVQRGLPTRAAVLTIYLATGATSLSAVLLPHADWGAACMIFAQCACVVTIIAILEYRWSAKESAPPANE